MKQIILHIPHSSTNIPDRSGYQVSDAFLQAEMLKLTDWYTDDLFSSDNNIMIKADFSRIFCDVERFADDNLEVMAKVGMGVLYEKSDNGRVIRKVNAALRERIVKNYYWKHHNRFKQAVDEQLTLYNGALIIDCHSFPDAPLKRDSDQHTYRPDFSIGTDNFHTPAELADKAVHFFENAGYSVEVNRPYYGSIVPLAYYRKNKKVKSIMLEINRKLYLAGNTNVKLEHYGVLKKLTQDFIRKMQNFNLEFRT